MLLYFGFSQSAFAMVYPICCLDVVAGPWGTAAVTAIVNGFIHVSSSNHGAISFEILFCLLLTVMTIGLQERGLSDNIMLKLVIANFIFVCMTFVFPDHLGLTASIGTFLSELFTCILVIFTIGPIKVWLDI